MANANPLTRSQAVVIMRDNARSIIDPEWANELLAPFGQSLETLGLVPRPTKNFYRASFSEETADLPSVAMNSVAANLALALAPPQQHATWKKRIDDAQVSNGAGMRAQEKGEAACALLDEWTRLFEECI